MEKFEYQEELNLCIGILREKCEDTSLEKLNNLTISFEKKDEKEGMDYRKEENAIYLNKEEFDNKNNKAQLFMMGLLQVMTTDKKTGKSGLSFDGKMEAFNRGITYQLANAFLPSEEQSLKDFECSIVANLFTSMISRDEVYDAYFSQDGEKVYSELLGKLGNDKEYLDAILSLSNLNMTTLHDKKQPSLLGYIQESVSQKYLENNDLSLEQMGKFKQQLFTEAEYAPDGGVSRLLSCATCDYYVQKEIDAKMVESSRTSRMDARRKRDLEDMFQEEKGKREEKATVRS